MLEKMREVEYDDKFYDLIKKRFKSEFSNE